MYRDVKCTKSKRRKCVRVVVNEELLIPVAAGSNTRFKRVAIVAKGVFLNCTLCPIQNPPKLGQP